MRKADEEVVTQQESSPGTPFTPPWKVLPVASFVGRSSACCVQNTLHAPQMEGLCPHCCEDISPQCCLEGALHPCLRTKL